ncbi:L-fuculokinase [Roseivivax sp. THAF40]|uniref:FGGY-family carbohydrate kinase n=1 Tax=unclassified Roseivivax TaxID=2639302 RepID=UPI0012688D66|nr:MULTISPECIES: FGGY-family carbohydrate kinase [unclassified Roseivivax]QFS83579.1 L-fuculokinase [Roseivivax sp. THAF197b]QFT47326.1 L-fuculokinase [Roseivivax sp. THAF40]
MTGNIAVIDIGKTNAKLALVERATLTEKAVLTRPNAVRPGPPWPHFDVDGHWDFLLEGLAQFHRAHGVDAISITTHGACAALLAADGTLAAPILDYEHSGPDELSAEYDAIRPDFAETGSPRLPLGLNIGAQLFWQFQTDPGLKARTQSIVTYPQYWAHRLTGVAATDVTSLGCHTDLWAPGQGRISSLVDRLGIAGKMAPPRQPSDVLGPILPEVAASTGLAPDTPVVCGIHDSNASLLPHVLGRDTPFSVVSTGTWVICMAMGGQGVTLDPAADTLINVNALGQPVPSARFMGGREHDLALQGATPGAVSVQDLDAVLDAEIMLLPALAPESGPFQGHSARWIGPEPAVGSGMRRAAVACYLALVTNHCLSEIGQAGPIMVEGPFARNREYLQMLGALADAPVIVSDSATGTSQGAALLLPGADSATRDDVAAEPADPARAARMRRYADSWAQLASQRADALMCTGASGA